jgi:hypothetical protein
MDGCDGWMGHVCVYCMYVCMYVCIYVDGWDAGTGRGRHRRLDHEGRGVIRRGNEGKPGMLTLHTALHSWYSVLLLYLHSYFAFLLGHRVNSRTHQRTMQ